MILNRFPQLEDGVFERMSFVGGPACGNAVNTSASSNTVIRDSAFYGAGGRYLFSFLAGL
ncbi:MAG: hypothetical protein GY811_30265 [Myxococcales bacterium]|nr:hypothetical protein [Myxococcales bacterium]